MKIQSLSIVVPTKKCVNNCAFCVSKTHDNDYKDCFYTGKPWTETPTTEQKRFEENYIERLEFAKDNNTNTIILTGTGEPLQNKTFLRKFAEWNKSLHKPFYIIELQTSGVFLDNETLEFLRDEIRVKTISLSVSDLFDNENNLNIIDVPKKLRFDLDDVCKRIKDFGFNLRISLNVLNNIEKVLEKSKKSDIYDFDKLFNRLKELKSDQITFRKLWKSSNKPYFLLSDIDRWIDENMAREVFFVKLNSHIKKNGRLLGRLTFGALQYEIGGENGISTVIDDDCMSEEIKEDKIKYLILRENAKLYKLWDSKASLIF